MPDKVERKVQRKQAKGIKIVKKDFSYIVESEFATRNVLVCNAGLVTGTSRECLMNSFGESSGVEKLVMIPLKSYSFVVFSTINHAKRAVDLKNGKVSVDGKGPVFLAFVNKVAEIEDPWVVPPPSGLRLQQQFINQRTEQRLIDFFTTSFAKEDCHSELKNRKVKHFGFEFDYNTNDIDPNKPIEDPIPQDCLDLMHKMVEDGLIPEVGDQMTVNLYSAGQGIPPHTDSHSCCTDWLCSLSLGSGVLMEFKDPKGLVCPVWLPRRSLLILKEEARYCWKHGITPRHSDVIPRNFLSINSDTDRQDVEESDVDPRRELNLVKRATRISLTFRKTLDKNCSCRFKEFCNDSSFLVDGEQAVHLEISASAIENKMVHEVYENIASHFSETRHTPWPKVLQFVQSVAPGGVLVDLGCGNGKYLGQTDGVVEIGSDFSHNLLKIVRERGFQGVRCDMLNVAFRDGCADGVICIAALHHLSTHTRRLEAVKEMTRILVPGGRILIYVWAKNQTNKSEMSSYLKQNKKNFKENRSGEEPSREVGEFGLPVHQNRTNFVHQDILVPWKLKVGNEEGESKTFQRYYHVFKEGELDSLIVNAGELRVDQSYYDQGNWCCIATKI